MEMQEFKVGMLIKSLAGHDKHNVYVIIEETDAYVHLADGKIRTINHLKKKKKKHIQSVDRMCDVQNLDDAQIRKIIRKYKKEAQNIGGDSECLRLT